MLALACACPPSHDSGQPIVEETATDKTFFRRRIDPDDQVVSLFHQIDHAILGDDFKLDFGVSEGKTRADLAEREKRWAAFLADPEWVAAVAKTEKDGQLVDNISNQLLAPAAFSEPSQRAQVDWGRIR